MNPSQSSPSAKPANRVAPRRLRWLPYLGAMLLVALILAGLWPRPTPVETTQVARGSLRATINEEGKTRVRNRYLVSAPVAGQLRRINLKAGATVEQGKTVVGIIDPLDPTLLDARSRLLAEARRDAAKAALAKAQAAHEFARNDLARIERLFSEGTVTIQDLEGARWREVSSARDVSSAESSLRLAEAELGEFGGSQEGGAKPAIGPTTVLSPASGRVLRVFEENSRVVNASTPLLEIGDPTDLEVVIEVLSRDGAAVAPGSKVYLEHWGGNGVLEGKLRLVEPAAFTKISALGVEEQRVRAIADLTTPPQDRLTLGDGFRVEARIVTWESGNVLKVPSGALYRRGQDWAVFKVILGRAVPSMVKTGRTSGTETEILEGLQEGEEIILYPGDRITAGLRIRRIKI